MTGQRGAAGAGAKKRIGAFFCALVLLAGVWAGSLWASAATPTVYILAVNDRFADLPTRPEAVNGIIYIPYTIFSKDASGTDLGVYYGARQEREKGLVLNLYSQTRVLTFTVSQGICVDENGNKMSFRAVMRNGTIYVPAAAVCSFFGLEYSFLATPDRGTLIRICDSAANLSNSVFLSAGSSGMLSRYNSILQSMEPAVSTPAPTSTPRPTPTPTPPASGGSKENVRVYLAVDASEAGEELLSAFGTVKALFLFTPESLCDRASLVRKAVAAGHSVGLIAEGSEEAVREQLSLGNDLLTHIARTRTRIVAVPRELTGTLTGEGWLCWQSNVGGTGPWALMNTLSACREVGRVDLPAESGTIVSVLSQIRRDRYTLRQPVETDL